MIHTDNFLSALILLAEFPRFFKKQKMTPFIALGNQKFISDLYSTLKMREKKQN